MADDPSAAQSGLNPPAHRGWLRGVVLALTLAALCALLATAFSAITAVHGDDLAVYRAAGQAVLHGTGLYDDTLNARLPFTYPPFAALVAVPLAIGTWGFVQWAWTFMSLLMLAAIIVVSYRGLPWARRRPIAVYGGFLVVWTLAVPVSDHLGYGQVGLFLTLLCLIDVLARPRWLPEGVLVGVAGAIKLVPLVYIGFYVITGKWRAVAGAVGGFAGATLLGLLVLPSQSFEYFGKLGALTNQVAVGDPTVFGNQSVHGVALRLLPEGLVGPVWLTTSALLAAIGVVAVRRAYELRGAVAGFLVVALLAAAVTPIAWTHHFVWLVPTVGILLAPPRGPAARRQLLAWAAIAAIAAVVLFRLPRLGTDLDVPVLRFVLENSLLWGTLLAVLALATVQGVGKRDPVNAAD